MTLSRTGTQPLRVLALMGALAVAPAVAQAQSPRCDYWIASLPYTATIQSGTHCLLTDLLWTTTGAAVTIEPHASSRMTLDLNGHRLMSWGTAGSVGILCAACSGAVIKNGSVEGFDTGIAINGHWLGRPNDAVLEQVNVTGAAHTGIKVMARGAVIRNNRVLGTGVEAAGTYVGIWVVGPEISILDNDVVDMKVLAGTQPTYIFASGAAGSVIEGNRVTDRRADQPGVAIAVGGVPADGDDVLVAGNRISGVRYGVFYYPGLAGKYRDNLTSGVLYPYSFGTDAGDNN